MTSNPDTPTDDTTPSLASQLKRLVWRPPKYEPILFGWLGILAVAAWQFTLIDPVTALYIAGFGSASGALLGHHALGMGWWNDT